MPSPYTLSHVDVDLGEGQTMEVDMLTTLLSVVLLGQVRTDNFYVEGDEKLAHKVSVKAEEYRKAISLEWFGEELPKIPMVISFKVTKNFSGLTTTRFLLPWTIDLTGTEEEILYTGLPHEVAHSVTNLKCSMALPLWASEGISMMCEREDLGGRANGPFARNASTEPLVEFLNRKDYPLFFSEFFYGQAYSLTRFLVEQKGKRTFTQFLDEYRTSKDWASLVKKHYGYEDVSEMEAAWLAWHLKTFDVSVDRQ